MPSSMRVHTLVTVGVPALWGPVCPIDPQRALWMLLYTAQPMPREGIHFIPCAFLMAVFFKVCVLDSLQ